MAFESLYDRYLPQLYPVILKIVRTESAVRDIVQEVFLYLWLDREKLPEVREPRHWIFRIAYNRSYTWVRRQIAAGYADQDLVDEMAGSVAGSVTEEAVQFSEALRVIRQAVHDLPPQSQRIYRMNREGNLRPGEIAERLGISVQSVKNALTRSRQAIREQLRRNGFEIPLLIVVCLLK